MVIASILEEGRQHGEPARCALHTLHFTPRGADLAAAGCPGNRGRGWIPVLRRLHAHVSGRDVVV